MNAPKPYNLRRGNGVEIGSISSKEKCDDIDDSGINDYKELSYKLFQLHDYKVRGHDGEFACPFCACKEEADYGYSHLLQHAIRVAEGSLSRKQRAKHYAMAKYLAFDLAVELKEEADHRAQTPTARKRSRPGDTSHLLQHAIRVAEGSLSRKQRAKHYATAKYLAFDLAVELKEEADHRAQTPTARKRSRPGEGITKNNTCNRGARTPARRQPKVDVNVQKLAMAEKREKEALDKVRELENKLDEMTDQLNDVITKDRLSNDELQGVRRELIEGLGDIQQDRHGVDGIGIKKFGELDPEDFISELDEKIPPGDIVIKGVELCTLWQEKIKDPHWYPFQIIEDDKGMPQRFVKKDDVLLQALKEEWGRGIHDAVVDALTDLQEHNPSGCYMVPELWNFRAKRKAAPTEVIRHIFKLRAAKATPKPKPRAQPRKISKG